MLAHDGVSAECAAVAAAVRAIGDVSASATPDGRSPDQLDVGGHAAVGRCACSVPRPWPPASHDHQELRFHFRARAATWNACPLPSTFRTESKATAAPPTTPTENVAPARAARATRTLHGTYGKRWIHPAKSRSCGRLALNPRVFAPTAPFTMSSPLPAPFTARPV